MSKRTNQPNLVRVARERGESVASSWSAYRLDDTGDVIVFHYGTLMLRVHPDNTVTGESRGWQSMTDKCGVRAILRNINGQGYAQVFADWGTF